MLVFLVCRKTLENNLGGTLTLSAQHVEKIKQVHFLSNTHNHTNAMLLRENAKKMNFFVGALSIRLNPNDPTIPFTVYFFLEGGNTDALFFGGAYRGIITYIILISCFEEM